MCVNCSASPQQRLNGMITVIIILLIFFYFFILEKKKKKVFSKKNKKEYNICNIIKVNERYCEMSEVPQRSYLFSA